MTGETSETITERERLSSPTGKPSGLHFALHLLTLQESESRAAAAPIQRDKWKEIQTRQQDVEGLGGRRGGVLQGQPVGSLSSFLFSCDKMHSSLCIRDKCAPVRGNFHITSLCYCDHLLPHPCQAPMDHKDHRTLTRETGTEIEAQCYKPEG